MFCLAGLLPAMAQAAECGVDLRLRDHTGSFQKFLVKARAIPTDEGFGKGREARVAVRFAVGWRDSDGKSQSSAYSRCFFVKWGVPSKAHYFELKLPRARSLEVTELSCRESQPDDQCQVLWSLDDV